MRGLDVREWKALDWAGAAGLIAAALVPAINAGLRDAPALASQVPASAIAFLSWPYLASVLLLVPFGVIVYRLKGKAPMSAAEEQTPLSFRLFQYAHEPPSDFKFLPQRYSVELAATLPYVEVCFFVVSFVPRTIALSQTKLSLRLFGSVPLESIPLLQDDFEVHPKATPIVVCRRNLTDSEIHNLPWSAGHTSGSFELLAKARDGDKTLSYGPVSSMVIDGWVNMPPKKADLEARRI